MKLVIESKCWFSSIKDGATGEITFYMKGADTVMGSIVQYNDWLEEEVMAIGRGGLRSLLNLL